MDLVEFERLGYACARAAVPFAAMTRVHEEILELGGALGVHGAEDIDTLWRALAERDGGRRRLYNALKRLPAIQQLAVDDALVGLARAMGVRQPAVVDVNVRLDSVDGSDYLFDWHQDYWFSMCSPSALVFWIPLTRIDEPIGGVELFDRAATNGRILRARRGSTYRSYADAVVLDEPIPSSAPKRLDLDPRDILVFRFDVLHRSLPTTCSERARWTVQVRIADFTDSSFRQEEYKPGIVSPENTTYWSRINVDEDRNRRA